VKDSGGKVYSEGSLSATRLDLDVWMKTLPQPWSAAMEATMFTGWIYDHLKPHAAALKVAHPLMLRAIAAAKKKNDRVDASKICDCLRCDFLPECYMASTAIRERRRTLRYRNVAFNIMFIGMGADEEQFIAAIRSGVTGYLLQDASASDVVAAVRAVFRGEAVCPPQLCSSLFRFVAQMAREIPVQNALPKPDLTLRQQQLVTLVAKGLTNKEIASHLNLSEFTVRNHIHRILKQVDAESRSEAVETIRGYGYPISP
jgi:DNA-binding NarL/FixJ family response regulator